jgi:hypothetical protein
VLRALGFVLVLAVGGCERGAAEARLGGHAPRNQALVLASTPLSPSSAALAAPAASGAWVAALRAGRY